MSVPIDDVRMLNAIYLSLLREAVVIDPIAACCRFGLSKDLLSALQQLRPQQLWGVVSGVGDDLLFVARPDLPQLLLAPSSAVRVLANAVVYGELPKGSSA